MKVADKCRQKTRQNAVAIRHKIFINANKTSIFKNQTRSHNLNVVGSNPAPATNFTAMKHDFMAVFVVFNALPPLWMRFHETWRTS